MNTMKREDMIKERDNLCRALFSHMASFFNPLTNILSGMARLNFLDEELKKVTPKPVIVKDEEAKVKDKGIPSEEMLGAV